MQLLFNFILVWYMITRGRGITRSVSAQRWEGDGFNAQPKPRHS